MAPQPVPQVNQWGQIGGLASQLYGMGQLPQGFKKGGTDSISKDAKALMPKAKGNFGLSGLKFKTKSMPKIGKKLPSMRKMRGSL